ncbi:MAG: hypothetical protein HYR49_07930 [Gammaproteobacteria bacterium]|nr:hypothetical protein [Gammaproteobacteria bacterium]
MGDADFWFTLSSIVTVFGLPLAIFVFIYEQRKEREDAKENTYLALSDAYAEFLRLVIANPDLRLRSQPCIVNPTGEQQERMLVIFDILISLFERAYILVYEDNMSGDQLRRWRSWEDYMREWCRREDFRGVLPELLHGEDPAFAEYIRRLAAEEGKESHKL